MGKYSENYKYLCIKRNGVEVILLHSGPENPLLYGKVRSDTEQHLMQHPILPNTKQEREVCEDEPNSMSWLESRDGRLEGCLSLKCCPQLQPGVSILHCAGKCSAWDEFPGTGTEPQSHLASGVSQG